MKKGKNLKELVQVDGKLEDKPRTLDQILGYTGLSKYQTMNDEEYQEKISTMNKSDLNKEAINRGLIPVENRGILEKRLMNEFRIHVASFRPIEGIKTPKVNKTLNKRALDILNCGR